MNFIFALVLNSKTNSTKLSFKALSSEQDALFDMCREVNLFYKILMV